MIKKFRFYILSFMFAFFLLPFSFTSAQQPQWYLHYYTGQAFDHFLDLHFVYENYGWVGGTAIYDAKLLKTTDGGKSWVDIQEPLFTGDLIWTVFFIDSLQGWLGMEFNRVLKTTDGGYNWFEQPLGAPDAPVRDIYFRNEMEGWAVGGGSTPGIPSIERGFIKRTTNGGNTWQLVNDDTLIYKESVCFSDSLHGIVTGWHQQIYTTNDGGITWNLNNNFNPDYHFGACAAVNDSTFVIIGSYQVNPTTLCPLFGKSTNRGETWHFNVWNTNQVSAFVSVGIIDEDRAWFGAEESKFVYTYDGGQTFQVFNLNVSGAVSSIQMLNADLGWACAYGRNPHYGPVFKYGVPTSIPAPTDQAITKEFSLFQNFPNPFNPVTAIEYQIPKTSKVVVEIFNILGQKVVTLVDEQQGAEYYKIYWKGTNNSGNRVGSGIYVFRMVAEALDGSENFIDVKKMILLK